MPRTPMTNRAYDILYRRMVCCEYLPGQNISEKLLLEETGLGRTPLREALLRLQKEGLVEIFPRKGMRVAPFTEKNVTDLYQTRKLLEPTVIAEYKTLYSKGTLLQFQKRFEQSEQDEDFAHFELDVEFHSYLISITDNKILTDMYHTLMVQQLRLAMYASLKSPGNRSGNLEQHARVIDALLRENEQDARDAIIFHINHSLITSLKAIRLT